MDKAICEVSPKSSSLKFLIEGGSNKEEVGFFLKENLKIGGHN